MGVPAQLVLLSLESDAAAGRAGVVAPESWRALPDAGVVNLTPFVILVRTGNPRAIRDFQDLARPGIRSCIRTR
jgi:sulfate transport system substrate-binding protein